MRERKQVRKTSKPEEKFEGLRKARLQRGLKLRSRSVSDKRSVAKMGEWKGWLKAGVGDMTRTSSHGYIHVYIFLRLAEDNFHIFVVMFIFLPTGHVQGRRGRTRKNDCLSSHSIQLTGPCLAACRATKRCVFNCIL